MLLLVNLGSATFLKAKVAFENLAVREAVEKAKIQGKLVFVDTYASWCAPCKLMDKVFENEEVGKLFNPNFINIKVNMDGPLGPAMLQDYDVVFLPTFLILDKDGQIITKIDRILSAEEIIIVGKQALSGTTEVPTISLNKTPFTNKTSSQNEENIDLNSKEKVIYIYDKKASSGRPQIMYHEAYLHLQLMDGQHQKVVKKYLSTQDDWSTEKNIRFIFDFLQDVNSKEFEYFIDNRHLFVKLIGEEKVQSSLNILVHQRLEQGYPRPKLQEAERLYHLINPKRAQTKAYEYFLTELFANSRTKEFIETAETYLSEINPYNDRIIYQYVSLRLQEQLKNDQLNELLEKMLLANSLHENNPEYLFVIARIYYLLLQPTPALDFITQCLESGQLRGPANIEYLELKKKISGL